MSDEATALDRVIDVATACGLCAFWDTPAARPAVVALHVDDGRRFIRGTGRTLELAAAECLTKLGRLEIELVEG